LRVVRRSSLSAIQKDPKRSRSRAITNPSPTRAAIHWRRAPQRPAQNGLRHENEKSDGNDRTGAEAHCKMHTVRDAPGKHSAGKVSQERSARYDDELKILHARPRIDMARRHARCQLFSL